MSTPQQSQPQPVCYYYTRHGLPVIEPDPSSLDQFKRFLDLYGLTPGQFVTQEMMNCAVWEMLGGILRMKDHLR